MTKSLLRDAWGLLLLSLVALAPSGCATPRDRAAEIVAAATPGHLRPVVACWEKEYESSGFAGEYVAIVDFEISRSEHIQNTHVTSLEPRDGGAPSHDLTEFRSCIEKAFDQVELPTKADADGPGYSTLGGVALKNYRIAFLGDQTGNSEQADGRQANVLIGPRADRCQGLYSHRPARDASALFTEIALTTTKIDGARSNKDSLARELQKMYDLQLELTARLEADLANPSLPPANRKRLTDTLETARREITSVGAQIGCSSAGPKK